MQGFGSDTKLRLLMFEHVANIFFRPDDQFIQLPLRTPQLTKPLTQAKVRERPLALTIGQQKVWWGFFLSPEERSFYTLEH